MDDQTRINGHRHLPRPGSAARGHRYANLAPGMVGTALLVGLVCGGTGLVHPGIGFMVCYRCVT